MELTINIKMDENEIDIGEVMEGKKTDIKNASIISIHFQDGALIRILDKAEKWDNLPEEIRDKYDNE